jgi:hypothetical protein
MNTMIITNDRDGIEISFGITQYIICYVRRYGSIVSLDQWAHELGISPYWARQCARQAAAQGKLKLTRMNELWGRPYKVEYVDSEER